MANHTNVFMHLFFFFLAKCLSRSSPVTRGLSRTSSVDSSERKAHCIKADVLCIDPVPHQPSPDKPKTTVKAVAVRKILRLGAIMV